MLTLHRLALISCRVLHLKKIHKENVDCVWLCRLGDKVCGLDVSHAAFLIVCIFLLVFCVTLLSTFLAFFCVALFMMCVALLWVCVDCHV